MYPKLTRVLRELAFDNEFSFKEEITLPSKVDLSLLEKEAERLEDREDQSLDEFSLLAAGEREEALALVQEKHLESLDEFLGRVFDGDLHLAVYE